MIKNFLNIRFKNFERSFYIALFALAFFAGTIVYAQQSDLQQIYAPQSNDSNAAGLSSPAPANAAITPLTAVDTVYKLACWSGAAPNALCLPDRNSWTVSMLIVDANPIIPLICNSKTVDQVKTNGCLTTTEIADLKTAYVPNDGQMYRTPGGFAGYLALATERNTTEPIVPTNLALFLKDSTSDTIIGQPAYAASVWDVTFERLVLTGWKISRNVALALLGLVIGISALMVMFRSQLGPRAVVTIYNVLPAIPITLGLILFSYPIAALLLGLIDPLTQFSIAFGREFAKQAGVQGGLVTTLGLGGIALLALGSIVGGVVSWGGGALATILILSVLLIIWVWVLIAYLMISVRILISLILTTMAAPLVILLSALPGRNALLMNLAKSYIVDLVSLPIFNIVYFLGMAIIVLPINNPASRLYLDQPQVELGSLTYAFLIFWIKFFIGIGMIWSCRNIRNTLKTQVGVASSLFGGGGDERGGRH